ncbi:P-loop containing nucleoside triphosphate hydrolase protein [Gilbertella persicaria]|uniref:P-loop containing nucleoside triphosphate hydrolase protein n=1 Tax=Gilbertella persicaria TaxID=101096 RepID=UPI00221F9EB7|nr:P-loop containing nucleoside triphosphate hydrolase protein [Gilbertella persicaria]KAI8053696.1 P-loop containing nucleoside triphosphate hydrolase protein [Gilbertella persicaria]
MFKNNSKREKSLRSANGTPNPHSSSTNWSDDEYAMVIEDIKKIYRTKIKPLEVTYNFEGFHSAPLTDSDIEAKPMVLLIGQYSTGKTTFIRYLLDKKYPGEHIGVEPTTDRFLAVMNGQEDRVIPGNAAAVNQELPFRGLNHFGQAFLSRFQVSETPSPVLENMTIIDTPGILAGDKQRIERGYDFTQVTEWFAQRADLILLMFDSYKLDISNEFKMAIHSLRGQEEKVRVVLNKSDMVSQQQLMRVYGAMMWSLGKVVQTPEVMRVYISSFWTEKPPNSFEDCRELIEAESKDLLRDLKELRRNAAIRKVNEIVKRARLARVHALIISHIRKEMPSMFGKKKKRENILKNLDQEFIKIQNKYHLPAGDFPNPEKFKQNLALYDMDKFKNLKEELLEKVDQALAVDLPKIMSRFPTGNPELEKSQLNPFDMPQANPEQVVNGQLPPSFWDFNNLDKSSYMPTFQSLRPRDGMVSGAHVKPVLEDSGLPNNLLADIWRLSDWDNDGYLDADQFGVAMHLIKAVQLGAQLPDKLPPSMMPSRKL